jgi:hypothetical protein
MNTILCDKDNRVFQSDEHSVIIYDTRMNALESSLFPREI